LLLARSGGVRRSGAERLRPTITDAMAEATLPDLVLYSRAGCHLCDEARELLHALLDERARQGLSTPRLTEIDIEADPDLERRFFTTIPVVELGDRQVELATSAAKLRRLLSDVLDGSAATTSA
jgi:glutaredoxin